MAPRVQAQVHCHGGYDEHGQPHGVPRPAGKAADDRGRLHPPRSLLGPPCGAALGPGDKGQGEDEDVRPVPGCPAHPPLPSFSRRCRPLIPGGSGILWILLRGSGASGVRIWPAQVSPAAVVQIVHGGPSLPPRGMGPRNALSSRAALLSWQRLFMYAFHSIRKHTRVPPIPSSVS